jgi:hypothetical protein
VFSTEFEHKLRTGETVRLTSGSVGDVISWSHKLQSLRLQFLKSHNDLIPEGSRVKVLLAAATAGVQDALSSMIDTIEGKNHLLALSFQRANPTGDVQEFLEKINTGPFDDFTDICREIAGRGGMINPLSEEESTRWNRPIPPRLKDIISSMSKKDHLDTN